MTGRPWSAGEVVAACAAQAEALQAEARAYDDELRAHRVDLHTLDGEAEAAWQHLCEVLVPELAPEALARVAGACELPSLMPAAVHAAQAREAAALAKRIAEIDATPEYVQREGLLNEVEIRVAECDESLAPLRAVFDPILGAPGWARLRRERYGTPEYARRWFQLSYYRDWKEGDELVELHGPRLGVRDFPGLLAKVSEAESAAWALQDERLALTRRRAAVEQLVRERDEAATALAQLPARTLASARGRLRGHLDPLSPERVAELFPGDPAVTLALQRISGLAAKRRYLVAAAEQHLRLPRAALTEAIARNERDRLKLSRPKHAGRQFPAAAMERRFRDRGAARAKRTQRYADTRRQVVEFHDYDRGGLAREFLWWDLMTDGRVDGDYIPEVQRHHARFGEPAHDRAVAAVADPGPGDDGLLLHDGS